MSSIERQVVEFAMRHPARLAAAVALASTVLAVAAIVGLVTQ